MIYDLSVIQERREATLKFKIYIENNKAIELKLRRTKRTISQNSYFHVAVAILAIEIGYTLEEMKTVLKREYGLYYEKNGIKFLRSTADLSKEEMQTFLSWLLKEASIKHNCYIPSAEDYMINQYEIDKRISSYEVYLK